MTDHEADDARRLLDDLDVELAREEVAAGPALAGGRDPAGEDAPASGLLGHLDHDLLDPPVWAAVDALLERGEGVESGARARLLAASERAMRYRQAMSGPLQLMLEAYRAESGASLDEVAAEAGVTVDELRELERGARDLASVDAAVLASWIDIVDVEEALALEALHRSLVPAREEARIAGGMSPDDLRRVDDFVADVRDALRRRRSARS